jgi:nitrate reductase gamma subunit
MTLLDFARGPALQWSLTILVAGIAWRLLGALLIGSRKDLSTARKSGGVGEGLGAIVTRSLPAEAFEKRIRFQHVSGYAWHIALFVTVLFFGPHILFFESILGFRWPNLPNAVVVFAGAVALGLLIALLIRRAIHPVQKLLSNFDDYFSLIVTMLPLITGFLAYAHVGGRYETLLAIHLLSIEALFIWFPFGKLMHTALTFPSRYQAGTSFGRKGVKA